MNRKSPNTIKSNTYYSLNLILFWLSAYFARTFEYLHEFGNSKKKLAYESEIHIGGRFMKKKLGSENLALLFL